MFDPAVLSLIALRVVEISCGELGSGMNHPLNFCFSALGVRFFSSVSHALCRGLEKIVDVVVVVHVASKQHVAVVLLLGVRCVSQCRWRFITIPFVLCLIAIVA